MAARAAVGLLGWEARRAAAREAALTGTPGVVTSLVSTDEADVLRRRTGREVTWLPPAVGIPARPIDPADGLVFLGGLDYLPNLVALRCYRDEVLPHLDPADPRQVLHVVGHVPDSARAELDVPGIELHGFVDDLAAALRRTMMVAPLAAGGGVKLKVLDGMAHGLPVAGLPGAFEGLGLPPELRLHADDGRSLAGLIRELIDSPARCAALGLAAREFMVDNFSAAAAAARWRDVLDGLPASAGEQPAG
ncbi:UNVERIFIED_ORG: glycosyltransferase [Bacillus sp. AZ43]